MKSKSGFTIVEIGIVVVVIGILATIGTVSYLGIQREARNSERQSDIAALSEALEKYYQKNGEYPSCSMLQANPDTVTTSILPGIQKTTLKAPRAPSSVINSITCSNPVAEGDDVYAYLGDGSSQCSTGLACPGWVIRYQKEGGEIAEIKSRHGSETAGYDANSTITITNISENPGIESNTNNLTATRVTLTRSNEWSAGGSYSARLTATGGGGSSDSYITLGGDQGALRTNLEAGKTYTVSATIQLPAPLTGTLHARSRTIAFWFNGASNLALSNQAPNITGQTRLSVTATIPPGSNNAWIRLYHGGLNGSGIVYWDNIMITEGSDLHGFADGNSTGWSWSGSPNNSISSGPAL